ncbi:MAG: hypothetical protein IT258_19470 [Saprospiraceae bacterium]|nr:hypothetical protein [Saprospiraceae bacterium]
MNFERRYEITLVSLNESFPELKEQNEAVLKSLMDIVENDPQKLIDFLRAFLKRNPITTTFFAKFKVLNALKNEEKISLTEKLEIISLLWELGGFLLFPANLLSKNKVSLNANLETTEIFKHFKGLGLSGSQKEILRQLRHSISHKLDIRGEDFFNEKGEKFAQISDVDIVYSKVILIYYWWLSVFVITALHTPRLASLVIVATTVEVRKEDSEMNTYISELKANFPDVFAFFERKNHIDDSATKKNGWLYQFVDKGKRFIEKTKSVVFKIIFPFQYAVGAGMGKAIAGGIGDLVKRGVDWFKVVLVEGDTVSQFIEDSEYKGEFIDSLEFIKEKFSAVVEDLKSKNR